jgi:hypothetical protein
VQALAVQACSRTLRQACIILLRRDIHRVPLGRMLQCDSRFTTIIARCKTTKRCLLQAASSRLQYDLQFAAWSLQLEQINAALEYSEVQND